MALRWDGKAWQQTKQPTPDGRLDDVLVKSANDVCAVGATEGSVDEPMRPILQHRKGGAWRPVDTAPEQNSGFTTLAAQGDGASSR